MMKNRLLTYCILLVLSFIDIKVFAVDDTPDSLSLLQSISAENGEQEKDRIQLKGTDVKVNIIGSIAEVTVSQIYKNNSSHLMNSQYRFPAPEKAIIHSIQMKTDENTFKGEIKEQKTAREEFHRFKEESKNALLLKQDSSNLITMNLANIMPGETVDVEFSYTELLTPDDMKYQFVYPAMPDHGYADQSEAEFNIEVDISAGIPIQELMCSTHETDIMVESESSAKVLLKNRDKKGNNQDYILNYRLEEQKLPSGLILSGGDENFLLLNDYIGSPGVKNASVRFTDLKTYDLEPSNIPVLSPGSPVTILGKWKGEAEGMIKVQGRLNRRDYSKAYRL